MKRLSLPLVIALFACITFSANAQKKNMKEVSNSNQDQPYKIAANNISIGNVALAQKVLHAWKDYDNNTLDNSAAMFSDDVVATFPDGTMIKGADNLIKFIKDYRNSVAAVSETVDACTTLKTPDDPDHEVVTIWGAETDTNKDGTITKTHLNEVWFFNKEGKVTEFHQMAAKEPVDKNKD